MDFHTLTPRSSHSLRLIPSVDIALNTHTRKPKEASTHGERTHAHLWVCITVLWFIIDEDVSEGDVHSEKDCQGGYLLDTPKHTYTHRLTSPHLQSHALMSHLYTQ